MESGDNAAGEARPRGGTEIRIEDLSGDRSLKKLRLTRFRKRMCPALGEYPLLRRLGRGAFGDVFLTYHRRLDRLRAVKLLRENVVSSNPDMRDRFLREARIASELSEQSQHLVMVHDVNLDRPSGLYYLAMEYVEGITAAAWCGAVRGGTNAERGELEALDVAIAATSGLCEAHRRGVIHRDVKPDNILIPSRDGVLRLQRSKLADLGLARVDEPSLGVHTMTLGGAGTPGFASPEQLRCASDASKPADVFGVGATLFALLVGRSPFTRPRPEDDADMARKIATLADDRQPIRDIRPDVSPVLDELVDTCLQHAPTDRYPDAFALLGALQDCRGSIAEGRGAEPTTTEAIRAMRLRPEEGRSVYSPLHAGQRTSPLRLVLYGGPPGAKVALRPRSGDGEQFEFELDETGQLETEAVESGTFVLTAVHPDFHKFQAPAPIILRNGMDAHCMLTMREREGFVVVASTPPGAVVVVDGQDVATTPTQRLAVAPGTHAIELRLDGFGSFRGEVEVRGGLETDLGNIALPAMGWLDLSEVRGDVHVLVDGLAVEDRGTVSPGAHTLTMQRSGYESQIHQVELGASESLVPVAGRWRPNPWRMISQREAWSRATLEDRERCGTSLSESLPEFEFVGVREFTAGEFAVFEHSLTGLEFILLVGDTFEMGSAFDEAKRRSDERTHRVTLAPFLIARNPVTQAVWRRRMDSDPSAFGGSSHPVEHVSWHDAMEFCEKAGLSLPTEAQWEYACRGNRASAYSFGDDADALPDHAWSRDNAGHAPRPVAQRHVNPFGLYDMHGNVWEWCADGYTEYPFDAVSDPGGSGTAAYRVLRGGSWMSRADELRSACRSAYRPDHRAPTVGFRPALRVRARDTADIPVSENSMDRAPPRLAASGGEHE